MLPVPQPHFLAAQPAACSGGVKLARRCELPPAFFMFVQGAAGIGNSIVGLMTVSSLHTCRCPRLQRCCDSEGVDIHLA